MRARAVQRRHGAVPVLTLQQFSNFQMVVVCILSTWSECDRRQRAGTRAACGTTLMHAHAPACPRGPSYPGRPAERRTACAGSS